MVTTPPAGDPTLLGQQASPTTPTPQPGRSASGLQTNGKERRGPDTS
ncbi:hypothetical protein [Streptomyces sp. NPDC056056]